MKNKLKATAKQYLELIMIKYLLNLYIIKNHIDENSIYLKWFIRVCYVGYSYVTLTVGRA